MLAKPLCGFEMVMGGGGGWSTGIFPISRLASTRLVVFNDIFSVYIMPAKHPISDLIWRPNVLSRLISPCGHYQRHSRVPPILTGQRMERPDHRVAVDLARVRPRVVEPDVLDGQHPYVAACKTNNARDGRGFARSGQGRAPTDLTRRPSRANGRPWM